MFESAKNLINKLTQNTSTQPITSANVADEDQAFHPLSSKEISSFLQVTEKLECSQLIPNLGGKKVMYITPTEPNYLPLLESKDAKNIFKLDVAKSNVTNIDHNNWVRSSVEALPFKDASFNFAFYPSALAWRADLPSLIPELSRILSDGSRLVITCVHPCFEFLHSPKNGYQRSIEQLYNILKKSGIFVEELREGTVEEALKYINLGDKRNKLLQSLKKLPLMLALKGLKIKSRKSQ